MSFVHLHNHSMYSILDGFAKLDKMVNRTKEMGMPAIALTDHGTMFGAVEFFNKAKAAEVKPIIGLETYVAPRRMTDRDPHYDKSPFHLLLLAENMTGWKNLLKIASDSQMEGFYYKPRIDHEYLAAHADGLIATTACLAGEVPQALANRQEERAIELLDFYFDVFGRDRFFLEYQRHDLEELEYVNQRLLQLSKRYNAHNIATNDAHYVDPQDAYAQDVMLAIQTNALLADNERMKMNNDSYYIRPADEMAHLFRDIPGAIDNTLWIAERCNVDLSPTGYHLPEFVVPEGFDAQSYLRKLCEDGLVWRYGAEAAQSDVIRNRLEHELKIIHEMGFDAYFLIVWDLCRYAREHNIWYNTRGSGAGSIVAYSLAVTLIDPIDLELIFERFLNPGRISMPDIDLDFQDDKRAEIMQYCANKYGADKVAAIITFGTLGAKAAIRDAGRVMDIPLMEVDRIAKMIPVMKAPPLAKCVQTIPDLNEAYNNTQYVRELVDTAEQIEGMVRNVGTHAAGVVITDVPITEYAPLHRATNNSEDTPIKAVCQFEMSVVDEQGLLKVDFLGLSTLTVMQRCCDLIEKRHGVTLNIDNIPVDDPETFAFLGKGNTAGVFQLEGGGMTKTLVQMQPKNLRNVIALVALYRPGPMQFIPKFIACLRGDEEPFYRHPKMEAIFSETYGIPVYQEQIMKASIELAGYSPSDSDDLRKAIAKKIKNKVIKHQSKFVEGCVQNGIDAETAEGIFSDWLDFAEYGFNKSHAADYALVAVQTAYLKCHYTVEYMAALISVYENSSDKVAFYVSDCRELGIQVLPPDVNRSGWDFTIEDQPDGKAAIRFGMGAIKNVGHGPAALIVAARVKAGPFTDLTDFARRVDLKAAGKRALESLIRVGAMDAFGPRRSMLEGMDRIMSLSASHISAARDGQMSFFGISDAFVDRIDLPPSLELDQREVLEWERELLGLFVSAHPLDAYMTSLRGVISHYSGTLVNAPNKKNVIVAGMVTRARPYVTKKGDPMAFAAIEDVQGPIELVVFPRAWKKYKGLLEDGRVVIVAGTLDRQEGDVPKVIVDKIREAVIRENRDNEFADLRDFAQPAAVEPLSARVKEPMADYLVTEQTFGRETEWMMDDVDMPFDLEPPDEPTDWGFETLPVPPVKTSAPEESKQENGPVKKETVQEKKTETAAPRTALPAAAEPRKSTAQEVLEKARARREARAAQEKAQAPARPAVASSPHTQPAAKRVKPDELPPLDDSPQAEKGPQKILITLQGSDAPDRDRRRLRRIYGELQACPGKDRFAFHVIENGQHYLIDFPNDTTGICPELLQRLKTRVGEENIKIE
ncbi:MAG: DNA polymerase III subunit alpha [Anaerolineae bacterium]|nr:DNA polymerase III subunit alpha [Anaerolineae bacterium]